MGIFNQIIPLFLYNLYWAGYRLPGSPVSHKLKCMEPAKIKVEIGRLNFKSRLHWWAVVADRRLLAEEFHFLQQQAEVCFSRLAAAVRRRCARLERSVFPAWGRWYRSPSTAAQPRCSPAPHHPPPAIAGRGGARRGGVGRFAVLSTAPPPRQSPGRAGNHRSFPCPTSEPALCRGYRWLFSAGSLSAQWDLQSQPGRQTGRTCCRPSPSLVSHNIPVDKWRAKVFEQLSSEQTKFSIMKKMLIPNLSKPLLYVLGLIFVFLFLISSMDVRGGWFIEDIIDRVSKAGQGAALMCHLLVFLSFPSSLAWLTV